MNIIVYCDKNGKSEGNCDFREFEISNEDEQNINIIIEHSIGKRVPELVCVLDKLDYLKMKNSLDEWENYKKWKEAKILYEKNKEKYEDVKSC